VGLLEADAESSIQQSSAAARRSVRASGSRGSRQCALPRHAASWCSTSLLEAGHLCTRCSVLFVALAAGQRAGWWLAAGQGRQ
jgi:hypothetical protein